MGFGNVVYDETPIEPLVKKTSDIYFFPSTFTFVFSGDSLLGVRPQWVYSETSESTPEYEAQLSRCADKFGVKVLDKIPTRQVYEQQYQRIQESKAYKDRVQLQAHY